MKFEFFNDMGKPVHIHSATFMHGTEVEGGRIEPQTERVFHLPEGTHPWVKFWAHGDHYTILVSPKSETYDMKFKGLEDALKELDNTEIGRSIKKIAKKYMED